MKNTAARIEILEARIAPAAVYLVSSSSLAVTDSLGADAQDSTAENNAQTAAGAGFAISLAVGDKLVFDSNNNHKIDTSDALLFQVKNGSAMVFVTDLDGNGVFGRDEISGIAVSNRFVGILKTDVRGDIVTALDFAGNFTAAGGTLTVQQAAIDGLSSTGAISGSIVSGGSMNAIVLGKPIFLDPTAASVTALLTGTASNGDNFNFGTIGLTSGTFTPGSGTDGGSITTATLPRGADLIETGAGGTAGIGGPTVGGAGKGGAITGVTVADLHHGMTIIAGTGGGGSAAISASGSGGAGGAISKITLTGLFTDGAVTMRSGDGGLGAATGDGGAGGAISTVTLTLPKMDGLLNVLAGAGGDAGGTQGAGGAGGALTSFTLKSANFLDDGFTLAGGAGGAGTGTGAGGVGGAASKLTITTGLTDAALNVRGGVGGDAVSGAAGAGGALFGVIFTSLDSVEGVLTAESGTGGTSTGGNGGSGGTFSASTFKLHTLRNDAIFLGGAGTAGAAGSGAGGNGGTLSGLTISVVDGGGVRHDERSPHHQRRWRERQWHRCGGCCWRAHGDPRDRRRARWRIDRAERQRRQWRRHFRRGWERRRYFRLHLHQHVVDQRRGDLDRGSGRRGWRHWRGRGGWFLFKKYHLAAHRAWGRDDGKRQRW